MATDRYCSKIYKHINRTIEIPPAVQDGKLLIRGTKEWDERERKRAQAGYYCLSAGPIPNKHAFDRRKFDEGFKH